MAYLDILRFVLSTLLNLIVSPQRPETRSLSAEFFCRFLRKLLEASKVQSIPWLRERQGLLKIKSPQEKNVDFEKLIIGGVPCQWCRPHGISQPERIVIYFHGGGYVIGCIEGYHNVLSQIAVESRAWVLAVDYRLGPENRFPAAHDDALNAVCAVTQQYPYTPYFLAGDSAGGGLAVSTTLALAKNEELPQPSGLALISPWIEPTNNSASMQDNTATDMFDRTLLMRWIELYMGDGDLRHSRVDFSCCDLSKLPPVYIQAGEKEIILDQIQVFAERGSEQGVDLVLDVFEDQFHVFQIFAPVLPKSEDALAQIGEFIRRI